jgi:hypothetical protein
VGEMSNDKLGATFHPFEAVLGDLPAHDPEDEVFIDENSIADLLCDQFQMFTAEGGNDLQGVNVIDATLGGRVVTVEWANGQRFRVLVEEL